MTIHQFGAYLQNLPKVMGVEEGQDGAGKSEQELLRLARERGLCL